MEFNNGNHLSGNKGEDPIDLSSHSITPPGAGRPLAERVAEILNDVRQELQKGEMTSDAYSTFVFKAACRQGILSEPYCFENAGDLGRLIYRVNTKLNLKEHNGVQADYVTLKGGRLSPSAATDVTAFRDLLDDVGSQLRRTIGRNQIYKSDFEDMVRDLVHRQLPPGFDTFREAGLIGRTIGTHMRNFKLIDKKPGSGGFDSDALDNAFDQI
jgi:hypothetical protein